MLKSIVLVSGGIVNGFRIHGPFASTNDASNYQVRHRLDACAVRLITPPPEIDKTVAKIRATRGLSVRVAEACGIKRAAVYQWTRVPIDRVHIVAELIDVPPEQIRPDIFLPRKPQDQALRLIA